MHQPANDDGLGAAQARVSSPKAIRATTEIRHVILDRDGVLNEESGLPVADPRSWRWIPGSLEALAFFARAGVRVSVATNQSAIGRGELSSKILEAIHERMIQEAREAGGAIDAVFVCPHAAVDACFCRKPAPGLIQAAIGLARIPERHTWLIGDDVRDLEAAAAAGIEGALVLTGKGAQAARARAFTHQPRFPDLRAAVCALTRRSWIERSES